MCYVFWICLDNRLGLCVGYWLIVTTLETYVDGAGLPDVSHVLCPYPDWSINEASSTLSYVDYKYATGSTRIY